MSSSLMSQNVVVFSRETEIRWISLLFLFSYFSKISRCKHYGQIIYTYIFLHLPRKFIIIFIFICQHKLFSDPPIPLKIKRSLPKCILESHWQSVCLCKLLIHHDIYDIYDTCYYYSTQLDGLSWII